MAAIFFSLVALFIFLFLFSLSQEQKLIKIFEDNDYISDGETLTTKNINSFEITLLNLGFLPSYRGEYQAILFNNKFYLECYESFDILTLKTITGSYSIKLPKSVSSIKNDIFTGKLLKINVKGQLLLFRLPNEMQHTICKRYK